MRSLALLPLAAALTGVSAVPWNFADPLADTASLAKHTVTEVNDWLFGQTESVDAQNVVLNGMDYLSVQHSAFPNYRLRVVEPSICDPSGKQLSGYLDISDSKHLFFWFEESRHKPKDDPLVLWLNGGPGCSSTTGLLFELGGCSVTDEGNNVTRNENSWNDVANVLFLDQPVGVGYSYSEDGGINNSPAAAEDVYAFLILFISQFKQYSKQEFHIAGESYAGTYIPNIANVIYQHNSALALKNYKGVPSLNFKSVLIGNGLTNPYEQFGSVSDWACEGPYAVFQPGSSQCVSLEAKQPRCQNLIAQCQRTNSRFACVPAGLYCWQLFNDIQNLGVNVYDVRRKCNRDKNADGPLCYKEMGWMETYLNKPEVKKQLGAPDNIQFQSCNMQINQNFLLQGDGVRDTASLLPPLIEAGIRVLIYSGEADALVNFIGCSRVVDALETSFSKEYSKASISNFTASDGSLSGWTKSAGKGAGNLAFVAFANAGHMVPHDDPIGALTMFERWLQNKPLAK